MAKNGMDIDTEPSAESLALSYEIEQEKVTCLRKVAETLGNTRPQNGIKRPPLFNQNMVAMPTKANDNHAM